MKELSYVIAGFVYLFDFEMEGEAVGGDVGLLGKGRHLLGMQGRVLLEQRDVFTSVEEGVMVRVKVKVRKEMGTYM